MTRLRPPTSAVAARRVAPSQAAAGDFTYAILPDDRRVGQRQRTRLRSGKVIDGEGQFVTECLIVNRSATGGMLRLPGVLHLPARILLFDDGSGDLLSAVVVWRRDREAGLRFAAADRTDRHRAIAEAMRRKYYALRR